MNTLKREDQYPEQDEVMFQCELKVHIPTTYVAKFISKADQCHVQNELLYRDKEELAIGHGVGVDWKHVGNMTTVYSTWMPRYELPNVEHCKIENQSFKMKDLSEAPVTQLKEQLKVIPAAYQVWLDNEIQIINQLKPYLKAEAEQNVLKVKSIIKRLEEGIALVTESEDSLQLFSVPICESCNATTKSAISCCTNISCNRTANKADIRW